MSSQSPLKTKPLRLPGQGVDDEIVRLREGALMDHLFLAGCVCVLATMEWFGYLTNSPRHPFLFTALAAMTVCVVAWRVVPMRKTIRNLKLGRDGEKIVAEQLECLRQSGAHLFHDLPGEGFNLDHVVISGTGSMRSKPRLVVSHRRRPKS